MTTLTIEGQVKTTAVQTFEIPVPCYMRTKDERHWLAVLDENHVVKFFTLEGYNSLASGPLNAFKSDVIEAFQTYHGITEAEFLQKYDDILESMHPKLKP